MVVDNDTRGWIMSCVSGVACVVGSSIICVDLIVQRIPGKRGFRIQDSDTFLSSSLSLSFGVMLFSSLYSMLPSSKDYLVKGGLSPQPAAYTVIGCFLGGVIGIQAVSRLMHHFIPSHVVDCDHSHEHGGVDDNHGKPHSHQNGHSHNPNGHFDESTPLLSRSDGPFKPRIARRSTSALAETSQKSDAPEVVPQLERRQSLQSRVSKLVAGAKVDCSSGGPCYGYSDPCAQECLKAIKSLSRAPAAHPSLIRSTTAPHSRAATQILTDLDEETSSDSITPSTTRISLPSAHPNYSSPDLENGNGISQPPKPNRTRTTSDAQHQHHHHVPTNAFLSIGLQTSIAIALHKLPEGFITFATNHANPHLGFAVFMALFIHNITEGFAMALPLYLAIGSRAQAMFWSSLLGGVSQPLGAGVAALWFKVAGNKEAAPGERVYGCMFAITAGIMASVALQLFSESLALNHNRNLCMTFAFVGMGVLGVSFALTAG